MSSRKKKHSVLSWCLLSCLVASAVTLNGCSRSHDETISGVQIPIPAGVAKSPQQGIELALPGFGGAQISYKGNVEPEKVMDFYKKEMPDRGWQPAAGLLTKGGMLSYTKEGKAVVIMVGSKDSKTTALTIMVGGAPR
jgi:hypothetical protein